MSSQSLLTEFGSSYGISTNNVHESLEVVVCLRCGRSLTNEKSRLVRLGPKCARKLAYETRTRSFSVKTLKYHKGVLRSSTQVENIPIQDISFYYVSSSPKKPYCKIGAVILPITDICIDNSQNYRKITYSLPLFEGIIYEISVSLPQARIFWLQVQNQQLKDISNVLTFGSKQ